MGFQGVEVGTENQSKIDPKRRCQRERVLASVLAGFGTVLGSKLSPKMEPNLEIVELGGRLGGQVEPQKTILAPNLAPRVLKNRDPAVGRARFSKNRASQHASIFDRFGCQLASYFPPKIHQNRFKNRS